MSGTQHCVNLKDDFSRFYLITWRNQILSLLEAKRFVTTVREVLGISDLLTTKFMSELVEEGVVLSEEVEYISDFFSVSKKFGGR